MGSSPTVTEAVGVFDVFSCAASQAENGSTSIPTMENLSDDLIKAVEPWYSLETILSFYQT
jgi:hypothetical protein